MRKTLLLAAALAAYGLTLAGSFHFDDYSLFSDPVITSASGWWRVWLPHQTRPLTWFSFWLNYRLGGNDPILYHAFNLALHLAAVWLAAGVLMRLLPERAAWIAAALFAIHPIQSEPVAYVFARAIVLATVFCLLSLDSWLRGRHWIAVAWFALALLAKEECAAFPVFLLLLHLTSARARRELAPIGAMMLLSLAAGLRVIWAMAVTPGAQSAQSAGITPWTYLLTQGPVILRYLRLLAIPWGFSADPGVLPVTDWRAGAAWLALAALALAAGWRFKGRREGFWFLGGMLLLLPSSSIFPVADLAVDRRLYLPMLAFSACAGLLLQRIDRRVLAAAALVLIGLSAHRSWVWRSEESLWTEAVERAPWKVRPKLQLARAVDPGRALALLAQARQLAPRDPDIPAEQGRVYLENGRPDMALAAFGRELALAPSDAKALNNRGAALLALGQKDAARADFERALAKDPCFFNARLNLRILGGAPPPAANCSYTPEQQKMLAF